MQESLSKLRNLLVSGLERNCRLDWEAIKHRDVFSKPAPSAPEIGPPLLAADFAVPSGPRRSDPRYQPQLRLLDKAIPSRREAKLCEARARFESDLRAWQHRRDQKAAEYESAVAARLRENEEAEAKHDEEMRIWAEERAQFEARQAAQHTRIDALRADYESKLPDAIGAYSSVILMKSDYPGCFPRWHELVPIERMNELLEFNAETGVLVVDFNLPGPQHLPTLTEVRYVESRDGRPAAASVTPACDIGGPRRRGNGRPG